MNKNEADMLAALQRAYLGDAIFRPSNASRWILPNGCPGSIQMIARLPVVAKVSGPAAREGTCAHKLAQIALTNTQGLAPEDFVGRTIQITDDDPTDTHFVDEQMAENVTTYVGIVDGFRATPGTEIYIERKLTLAHLDPTDPLLNECRGTGDMVAINRGQRWMAVADLKYGKGIPVPRDSPQPKIYLLMLLLEYLDGTKWEWGSTLIFQPRLPAPLYTEEDHYKPFIYEKPAVILGEFLGVVLGSMHAALAPDPKLNPSVKNCEWCDAVDICPAARDAGIKPRYGHQPPQPQQTALSVLQPFPQIVTGSLDNPRPPERPNTVVLPAATDLDLGELADVLNGGAMFEVWYTGVKHRAAQLIEAGSKIPGWYLKPRTGNRRWKLPREVVEQALLKLGLKPQEIYTDPKMRSPKQVEDALPSLLKGAIEPLYERPPGAPTLVSGSEPPRDDQDTLATLAIPSFENSSKIQTNA